MRRLLLGALCGMTLTGCVSVNGGNRPMGSIMGQMEATPQPGDWCRVTYPEQKSGLLQRSRSQVTGQVEAVDEDGIHLSKVHGRNMQRTAVLEKVPYLKRYFKQTGVGPGRDTIVQRDSIERLETLDEQETRDAQRSMQPLMAQDQTVVKQLVAAVPGRR